MIRSNVLIIFVKSPVLGQVKSKLADAYGEKRALEIHKKLLEHTNNITKSLPLQKWVFYDEKIDNNDIWDNSVFRKFLLKGNDLGEKMLNAFKTAFASGAEKAVVIGSDCMELSGSLILESFDFLDDDDVLLGPAKDGGFYLLGMNSLFDELFTKMSWTTNRLFREAMDVVLSLGLSYTELPVLSDIKTPADVEFYNSIYESHCNFPDL